MRIDIKTQKIFPDKIKVFDEKPEVEYYAPYIKNVPYPMEAAIMKNSSLVALIL